MKQSKYSYLSKNVLLFALNGFVPKLLSFLLIPIYTGCLSTEQYGVSDLILTTVQLLIPIFTLDIQDAVMRYAMDKNYEKDDVFSSALRIIGIGFVLVVGGTVAVSFMKLPGIENSYLFFFVLMYITTALQNTVSLFCRTIEKVQVIVVSSALHSIITLSANILFLVVFQWGLNGYLLANSIGSVVGLIYCFIGAKLHRYIKWRIPPRVGQAMRMFSFPLIFSVIAWWINNASDRYILSSLAGVAASGIYAVAYKIPNLLSMFQNIFAQAWSISAIKEYTKDDSDGFIGNMYTMMNFAMVFICSCIMVVDVPVAKILYSNEFFEAWCFVPPLLISVVFNAMALFIGSIFTAVRDTATLAISTVVGAVANIGFNFALIPFFGAYGAAIATLISYGITLLMRHVILRKHIHMKIRWNRDFVGYGLLLVQMVIAYFGWKAILPQAAVTVVIVLLYVKEIKSLAALVKGKLFKKKA